MTRQFSVTIGITAFNEEKNIKNLLLSLINQKKNNFWIKEIIVISDCSDDKTVEKAKELSDARIKIINGKKRAGQNLRLNQILRLSKTDCVVLFEADSQIVDSMCLSYLIKPFLENQKTDFVYGTWSPLIHKSANFFERTLIYIDGLKKDMFQLINNGENVYMCGTCQALSKKFADKFRWPKDVPQDSFIYLYCKHHHIKTLHQPKAVAYYRNPSHFQDYLKKSTRYVQGKTQLVKYIPNKIIDYEYIIPRKLKLSFYLKGLITYPVHLLIYTVILLLARVISVLKLTRYSPLWSISKSTKNFGVE